MIHRLALLLAAAVLLPAAAGAATYSAKPAAPAAAKRIVARDISWACGPAACQGSTDDSRPLVLCQALAKQAGRIESFVVDGRALAGGRARQVQRVAARRPAPALAAQLTLPGRAARGAGTWPARSRGRSFLRLRRAGERPHWAGAQAI